MASKIGIWNKALARLPANNVASLDENSLEARECRRFYDQVVSEMLGGPHGWSFQNRRVALAAATNDRAFEWVYAYAVPSDMAAPTRLLPDLSAAGLGLPVPIAGEPYAETWLLTGLYFETPYILENDVIYTNASGAILEYGINSVEESRLSGKVEKALSLQLAAELSLPIKKDAALRKDIIAEAEVAWSRAMAEDENRQPQTSGGYLSETILARSGYLGQSC